MLDAIFSQVKQEKEVTMTPSIPQRPTKPNGDSGSNLCSKLIFDGETQNSSQKATTPTSPVKEFVSKIDDASDDDDVSFDDVFGPEKTEEKSEKGKFVDENLENSINDDSTKTDVQNSENSEKIAENSSVQETTEKAEIPTSHIHENPHQNIENRNLLKSMNQPLENLENDQKHKAIRMAKPKESEISDSDSENGDSALCIDDPDVPSPKKSPVKESTCHGADLSYGDLEIDTGEASTLPAENEKAKKSAENVSDQDQDITDKLDTTLDEILKTRSAPIFLTQRGDNFLIDSFQTLEEILPILPDSALRLIIEIVDTKTTDKILRELMSSIREEMRNFRKTRMDLKFFVKVEIFLVLTFAILRAELNKNKKESGKILELLEFIASNVNTRINESIVFCK